MNQLFLDGSLIVTFAQDMSKAVFLDDYKTQSAVLYQLIVMGEAVKRLSSGLKPKSCNKITAPSPSRRVI